MANRRAILRAEQANILSESSAPRLDGVTVESVCAAANSRELVTVVEYHRIFLSRNP